MAIAKIPPMAKTRVPPQSILSPSSRHEWESDSPAKRKCRPSSSLVQSERYLVLQFSRLMADYCSSRMATPTTSEKIPIEERSQIAMFHWILREDGRGAIRSVQNLRIGERRRWAFLNTTTKYRIETSTIASPCPCCSRTRSWSRQRSYEGESARIFAGASPSVSTERTCDNKNFSLSTYWNFGLQCCHEKGPSRRCVLICQLKFGSFLVLEKASNWNICEVIAKFYWQHSAQLSGSICSVVVSNYVWKVTQRRRKQR